MRACLLLCLLATASTVLAQEEGAPGAPDESEAQPEGETSEAQPSPDAAALIDEGIALREAGRDEEALHKFEQAHAAAPSPRTLTQIALAEAALGRWLAADTHLREALGSSGDEWLEPRRSVLQGEAARIARRIGSLEVLGSPEGAEVLVDGRVVGRLPLEAPLRLLAGVVRLEVRAEGYYALRRNVEVRAETLARESARLAPEPTETDTDTDTDTDTHTDTDTDTDTDTNTDTDTYVAPSDSGSGLRTGGVVALGGSVIFGALALTMYLVRENNAETFNSDQCLTIDATRFENCRSEYDRVKRTERASAAMLAGAGVAAATGIVLFLLGSSSSEDVQTGMRCGAGPGDVGVSCGARF